MGTGSSRRNVIKAKVRAVGKLEADYSKHQDRGSRVEVTFTDTASAWAQLRNGLVPNCNSLPQVRLRFSDFNNVPRKKTLNEDDSGPNAIPYKTTNKVRR